MLDIQVQGAEDLRRMATALRRADRTDLARNLNKGMRRAADPMKRAVQDSAEGIHTTGFRKPGAKHPYEREATAKGTRKAIAEAVTVDVRVSEDDPRLRIQVQESKLPARLKGMPRKFDAGKKWRHPVEGNRNAWVDQIADPWFFPPIKEHLKDVRAEMGRAVDETREMLERATVG
jgi:hypothetical protein